MKLKSIAVALLMFNVTAANAEALGLLEMSPLYKEVVASNPGIEAVHPYFVTLDTDSNGIADTVDFRFDVYPVASNVKIHNSPLRRFTYPVNPCTNPSWSEAFVDSLKFLGSSVPRSHIAFDLYIECQEAGTFEYKEAHKTIVYSSNVSVPLGSTWTKVFFKSELTSFDGIDVDGNDGGTNELVLTMAVEADVPTSFEAVNTRTVAMEGLDGKVVFDKQRALFR